MTKDEALDKVLNNLLYWDNHKPEYDEARSAPVQEPVVLRPEDVTVEVLMVQSGGGFAPLKTHGVKLTHKPTGIVVQCSSERSQHRNREKALRDLERYLHEEPFNDAIKALHEWTETDWNTHQPEVSQLAARTAVLTAMLVLKNTPPAAQPAVPLTDKQVGRTDREIVDQTEELAGFLMRAFHRREKADPLSTFRGTQDIRAQHCWQTACQIQEMLTDTDPMNAVAEVDDEAAHGITEQKGN